VVSYAAGVKALSLTFAALALTSCSGAQHRPPRTRLSVKQIVERSKPAIVRIESKMGKQEAVGTGFAIDASGIIATNLHVVRGADQIRVTLLDGTAYDVAQIIGVDPDRDLTLLSIAVKTPMPTLVLGDSDLMEAGDPVVAIGNPLGVLDYTVSDGLISSVRKVSDQLTLLQTSAPISQGSSGGPLFNTFGEVIGVATAIFTEGQNLNLAVPSKYVSGLLASPGPMTVEAFAEATRPEPTGPQIIRDVPKHDVAILDGCSDTNLIEIAKAIAQAIELGAPLYNDGKHAECFAIYEGTADKYARDAECEGVRQAFTAGLERARNVESPTEKAWALRDTFDGLLEVILRAKGQTQPTSQ
jgi:serine protease Do